MANESNLEAQFARIESVARESGSAFIKTALHSDDDPAYRVLLSLEDFLMLLAHCRPRVVYALAIKFDARESLLVQLEVEDDDADDFAARPDVKAIIKQASRHNGVLGGFTAHFMVDGVQHTVIEQTPWFEEFDEIAGALEESLADQQQKFNDQTSASESAKFREQVQQLSEHPKFNDGRPSHEKRSYLAHSLFPDADRSDIYRIVDEAINMTWLAAK